MQELTEYSYNTFESIKQYTDDGREYWYARDLQRVLDYVKWSTFTNVINKAKQSCQNSGANVLDHFADVGKTIDMPKGATQTDEKLRHEGIIGKEKANEAHYQVGKKVRQTIEELGGTMPENLETPKKSVKSIEREQEKKLKK